MIEKPMIRNDWSILLEELWAFHLLKNIIILAISFFFASWRIQYSVSSFSRFISKGWNIFLINFFLFKFMRKVMIFPCVFWWRRKLTNIFGTLDLWFCGFLRIQGQMYLFLSLQLFDFAHKLFKLISSITQMSGVTSLKNFPLLFLQFFILIFQLFDRNLIPLNFLLQWINIA